jgi:orotidine-5'-phosphate decarboxylase
MTPGVIVALDVDRAETAVRLARDLASHVDGFLLGAGLVFGPGPASISAVAALGPPVLVDAPIIGVPARIREAAERLVDFGARWITAASAAGPAGLAAAVDGTGAAAGVIALPVPTTVSDADLASLRMESRGRVTAAVARSASAAGCQGIVCSPGEINVARSVSPGLEVFVPGVRMDRGDDEGHVTVASPSAVAAAGAAFLIVGREVREAPDPIAAVRRIRAGITESD